ncbi:MAG: insulinase family protein, partial [Bacteroidetes bacterium]|nr:insulinase family protein [Bacteroidota bacterium]
MKPLFNLVLLFLISLTLPAQTEYREVRSTGVYPYTSVTSDPTQTRTYVLPNGLTVMLSVNREKPRIQTYIATKAGSKNDPKDHTGLAHYLEHMLFKGTDKYGSLDWAKEKVELDKIDEWF